MKHMVPSPGGHLPGDVVLEEAAAAVELPHDHAKGVHVHGLRELAVAQQLCRLISQRAVRLRADMRPIRVQHAAQPEVRQLDSSPFADVQHGSSYSMLEENIMLATGICQETRVGAFERSC